MKTSPHNCLQASIGLGLCCWLAASLTNPNHVGHSAVYRKPPARCSTSRLTWTPGDVEGDFERLESAIKLDNAQDDLLARTRVEMIDFMASSRKEVSATILSLLQGPLLTSLLLSLAFREIAGPRAQAAIDLLSALQFAVCVVAAPLLLLTIQSRKRRYYETTPLPKELQGIGEHYLRFLTFYENPRLSCKDSVLCLLELWSFAVLPGLLYRPLSLTRRLGTRLAATASLRQYPAQAYELWYQQRHPLTGMVVALRTFEKLMLSMPMFIIDASLLLARLRPEWIVRGYAIAFLFGITSYLGFKHIKPQNKVWNMVARFRVPLSLCTASLAVGLILKYHTSFAGALQRYMRPFDAGAAQIFSNVCLMSILRTILATLSCAGALWNLASIQDNLRLAFTHNISLATLLDDDGSTRANAFEDKESFKWRYWSAWREPERISQSLRTIGSRFWHWLFLEGSVDERLSKAKREKKLPILDRLKDDEFDDRAHWKTRAMSNVAELHRRSIIDGSVLDPLGCAIYDSFGIGLGFLFDHMTPPANETKPSTRLLQARAAKSAHKRAVELFDAGGVRDELKLLEDPGLRHKHRREILKPQALDELDYMARRLTELVPREGSLTASDNDRLAALSGKLLGMSERSPSVQKLLRDHASNDTAEEMLA